MNISIEDKHAGSASPHPQTGLFSPLGRLGVLGYNARLFGFSLIILVGFIPTLVLLVLDDPGLTRSSVMLAICVLAALAGLAIGLFGIIITSIKRLHDLNFGGWYYLVGLIPIAGGLWFLYYSLKPGSTEANNFGQHLPATGAQKLVGVIGILLTLALTVMVLVSSSVDLLALLPTAYR